MKNKKQNRRHFLKNSLATAAVATVFPSAVNSVQKTDTTEGEIIKRKLGNTELELSVVSMGAGDTDNPKLVEAALDNGIQLLATSEYYGNGNNERMIGEVLKKRKREDVILMTSAMPDGIDHKKGIFTEASTKESLLKKINGNLERLGVDQIDIFVLPFAAKRESVFFEPMLSAMQEIKNSGKARYLAVATHKFEAEALRAAADTGVYDIVMTSYNFKRSNLDELNSAIAYAANKGLGIIAMKTMAGVYWDKERTKPINTKASLKWVLQNPDIHTTVPGFTSFDQLQQNIEIMKNISMSKEEMNDLKITEGDTAFGIYCQQCAKCVGQCKAGVDIPTLMRSYMYAYGYRNMKQAKHAIELSGVNGNPCNDCRTCRVSCAMRFDVKGKIEDIVRLKEVPEEFLT
jgi:predicted aldo/keto reductase-like oxidoreductase